MDCATHTFNQALCDMYFPTCTLEQIHCLIENVLDSAPGGYSLEEGVQLGGPAGEVGAGLDLTLS